MVCCSEFIENKSHRTDIQVRVIARSLPRSQGVSESFALYLISDKFKKLCEHFGLKK